MNLEVRAVAVAALPSKQFRVLRREQLYQLPLAQQELLEPVAMEAQAEHLNLAHIVPQQGVMAEPIAPGVSILGLVVLGQSEI